MRTTALTGAFVGATRTRVARGVAGRVGGGAVGAGVATRTSAVEAVAAGEERVIIATSKLRNLGRSSNEYATLARGREAKGPVVKCQSELADPELIARTVMAGQEGISSASTRPAQIAFCIPRDKHTRCAVGGQGVGAVVAARAELCNPELLLRVRGRGERERSECHKGGNEGGDEGGAH